MAVTRDSAMVAVGYMDPGNWATDIAAGSRFGYRLRWVLVMANFMAILLQTLAARNPRGTQLVAINAFVV